MVTAIAEPGASLRLSARNASDGLATASIPEEPILNTPTSVVAP